MLFTDVKAILLIALCWISFASVAPRHRGWALAWWGAAFYVAYAASSAPVVFGVILLAYLTPARWWLAVVALAVGVLVYYKFGVRATGIAAIPHGETPASMVVPLGLSFLSFELIHFCVERGRGRIGRAPIGEFLAFALFIPCRVAGPIRRWPQFAAAVAAARPSIVSVYAGLIRVLIGLIKKVAIADLLGLTVNELPYVATSAHALKVLLAFSLQIYLDFSAYSDIAIGISQMFGITVPENFRSPYLSSSIQEFWTRWHISLSTWVRDYVFLPFGQAAFATRLRQTPAVIAVVSYLVAFLIIGAWHGLTAPFILWGLYHGVLSSLYHVYRRTMGARVAVHPFAVSPIGKALATGLTFALVTLGWVLFLTPTVADAARLIRVMAGIA